MEDSREMGCKDRRLGGEITRLICLADALSSGLALQNRTTLFFFSFFGAELREEQEGELKTSTDGII